MTESRRFADSPTPTCPTTARHEGDLLGCGSTNIAGPDREGIYDCRDCGLWFTLPEGE